MEDAAYELREVTETLAVLENIINEPDNTTSLSFGTWQIFSDVLGKQIEKLDSIGLSISKEYYKPVLLKPAKTEA